MDEVRVLLIEDLLATGSNLWLSNDGIQRLTSSELTSPNLDYRLWYVFTQLTAGSSLSRNPQISEALQIVQKEASKFVVSEFRSSFRSSSLNNSRALVLNARYSLPIGRKA